ncbi:MAG: 3'-5' exonuclease [Acidobacteriota bacterium]
MHATPLDRRIADTPIAIFDVETTGLSPEHDRVVEISVARLEPGGRAETVFDTLIHPQRSFATFEINGILESQVAGAPTFEVIAGDLMSALAGCVLAAYNVSFDIRFLRYEFARLGIEVDPPYVCIMQLRPMLELGKRCDLSTACRDRQIDLVEAHCAGHDAVASLVLLRNYLQVASDKKIETFGDLQRLGNGSRILASLSNLPIVEHHGVPRSGRTLSRFDRTRARLDSTPNAMQKYSEALCVAMADFEITDREIEHLQATAQRLGLGAEQVRALHGMLFTGFLTQFMSDQVLDESEAETLRLVHRGLSRLGWAPGD